MNRAISNLCAAVVAIMLSACATSPKPVAIIPSTGNPVQDGKNQMQAAPPRDKVLWEYRTAASAMLLGRFDDAKQLLDDALLNVSGVIGPDKSARRARSNFVAESQKRFIGEPYERVTAYYYRGILYWRDNDIDNARACFLSAQFQDSDAEKSEYRSDYVLLDYLVGLTKAKQGNDGSDMFDRAKSLCKMGTPPPPYDPQANVLVFLALGNGPTKYATGKYRQELRFRPGYSAARAAKITVGTSTARIECCDDLSYQATTRGGRVMDHVLANKAVFKSTSGTVGNVAIAAGVATAAAGAGYGNNNAGYAGLALLAVGLIAKGIEASANPTADTRTWNNLPQYLGFGVVRLPPGQRQATVEFLDPGGMPLGSPKTITIDVLPPPRDTVVFISDK